MKSKDGRGHALAMSAAALSLLLTALSAAVAGLVLVPADTAQASPDVPVLLGIGEHTAPSSNAESASAKGIELASAGTAAEEAFTGRSELRETPLPNPAPAPKPVTSAPAASRGTETGDWSTARVSWYGPGFYGNTMAGGGTLTPGSMVAAHRSLPFGTRVQFEYNGRSCVAVVQDRGPYVGGRTFDLGPGTATTLGFGGVGTVRYRILGR